MFQNQKNYKALNSYNIDFRSNELKHSKMSKILLCSWTPFITSKIKHCYLESKSLANYNSFRLENLTTLCSIKEPIRKFLIDSIPSCYPDCGTKGRFPMRNSQTEMQNGSVLGLHGLRTKSPTASTHNLLISPWKSSIWPTKRKRKNKRDLREEDNIRLKRREMEKEKKYIKRRGKQKNENFTFFSPADGNRHHFLWSEDVICSFSLS